MDTLSAWIARAGPLPATDAVAWVVRYARTLERLHARGIAHGSISPDAMRMEARAPASPAELVGSAATSRIGYWSPERCATRGARTSADDIWALAATLYEALTGSPAFPGETPARVRARIAAARPLPLAAFDVVDDHLQAILDASLARDPSVRPTTMEALRRRLERWLREAGVFAELGPVRLVREGAPPASRATHLSLGSHPPSSWPPTLSSTPAAPPSRSPGAAGAAPRPVSSPAPPSPGAAPSDDDDEPPTQRRGARAPASANATAPHAAERGHGGEPPRRTTPPPLPRAATQDDPEIVVTVHDPDDEPTLEDVARGAAAPRGVERNVSGDAGRSGTVAVRSGARVVASVPASATAVIDAAAPVGRAAGALESIPDFAAPRARARNIALAVVALLVAALVTSALRGALHGGGTKDRAAPAATTHALHELRGAGPSATPRAAPLADSPGTGNAAAGTPSTAPELAAAAAAPRDLTACVLGLLAPDSAAPDARPSFRFLCLEEDPRRGADAIRTEIVRTAGSRVTDAMREHAVLGWYDMAEFAVLRARCCDSPPPLRVPIPFPRCGPLDRKLDRIAAAALEATDVASPPLRGAVDDYTRAATCIVQSGLSITFGRRGLPTERELATWERMLARMLAPASR